RGGFVKLSGIIIAVIGAIMFVGGASTWVLIQNQLSAENIVVAEDASFLAGDNVNGPFSAYAQAQIINEHALDASGGKTYAELDREDPVRAVVMNGSFLRASLFTSVLAFGVSAMAMGLGLVQVLGGVALHKLGRHEDL
ncbi:MAG TPA: aromatic ring-opening dioxygenase LigA, partial [Ornithinibacter sp.]|nr:aromatic ring-opening dioxygenase LigA [Ornithinibacter sp.]